MLPAGPRSTYPVPPAPQLGARELARQILGSMQARIAAATELKVGTVTTGCDGMANINPLNGTNCNGAAASSCDLVLYNPQNRTVVATRLGRALSGSLGSCAPNSVTGGIVSSKATTPASCDKVVAALRKRRRFVDSYGNIFDPDGKYLSPAGEPAQLEADYIHRLEIGQRYRYGDPPRYVACSQLSLKKVTGLTRAFVTLAYPGGSFGSLTTFQCPAQGLIYPSVNDTTEDAVVGVYMGQKDPTSVYRWGGLNDASFDGTYTGSATQVTVLIRPYASLTHSAVLDDLTITNMATGTDYNGTDEALFDIEIDSVGTLPYHDTYKWRKNGGAWSGGHALVSVMSQGIQPAFAHSNGHTLGDSWTLTLQWGDATALPARPDLITWPAIGVVTPITGAWQDVGGGMRIKFDSIYGHQAQDQWRITNDLRNVVIRTGVAVRGTIDTANPCVNGGYPNSNVLMTTECRANFSALSASQYAVGSHALVVRDPDTLAVLYRKPLDLDSLGYTLAWGDPPEKFSFSTDDEGLFFMHCYTTPVLASPPTPYPGHEFGAPNPRKVAVISVNGLTFEPTIVEVITLEENERTGIGAFVTAYTVPG